METCSPELLYLRATPWLTIIGVGVILLLYWLHLCPVLYRHGARFPTGLALHRVWRDLRRYRAIRYAQAKSLNAYYVILLLAGFTGAVVLTMVVFWIKNTTG